MSSETAEVVSSWSNWFLLASLIVGVIATFWLVVSSNVKERALRSELAEANVRTADLQRQAYEARARLESERIERLRLAGMVAPRILEESQKEALADAWRGYAGKTVTVRTYVLDMEAAVLAAQLIDCFRAVGIKVDPQIASIMPMGLFATGISVTGPDETFVDLIADTLALKAGQTVTSEIKPVGRGTADAVVLVGVKQIPISK